MGTITSVPKESDVAPLTVHLQHININSITLNNVFTVLIHVSLANIVSW